MKSPKNSFSVRHPFLFGFSLLLMAVVLLWGAAAFFNGNTVLFSSEKIGIVNVQGTITNSLPTVKFLRKLRRDKSVKGVLLRINSPGGTIAPSQELYHAVKSFADEKPIVASFGTVAASGGYYAAAPATKIMASSGSITGSIGVKAEYANFSRLMDKVGVRPVVITSGSLKGAGSPYSELTPEQREYLTRLIMDMHNQFVDDVAAARKLDRKKVEEIADGRAMTGREAKELGLVDRIGGYEDSVAVLKALCGLEGDIPVIEGPEIEKPLIREILGYFGLKPVGSVAGEGLTFSF
ncbi:signal peptide peptidase SppA [Maridesulfovibrio hydrothermalis]|uniref:Signal peptide peptidase SppA, 36K type n=1 Tax=Maridesulfovibrio hydrothermalis AM13 = DSM 14728 TaxID=1121451 RepID=L0R929_9BACT|nr:signal peptide peptidase SppA [Maridesulfovibrio hydrothermalis]CCO22690.1 Signal peptide peptidase SppA, 36K type [Maridesulfovibrio hydrothermalis AM13 = DSM 14728]